MLSIRLYKYDLYIEVRRGTPHFYFERRIEDNAAGGTFDTVVLGVPFLHIEFSRESEHDHENDDNTEAVTEGT